MNASPSSDHPLSNRVVEEIRKRVHDDQFQTWFRGLSVVEITDTEIELTVPSVFLRNWVYRHFQHQIEQAVQSAVGHRLAVQINVAPHRCAPQAETEPAAAVAAVIGDSREPTQPAPDALLQQGLEQVISDLGAPSSVPVRVRPAHVDGVASPALPQPSHANGNTATQAQVTSVQTTTAQRTFSRDQLGAMLASAPANFGFPLNENYTFEQFVVGSCNRLAHAAALAIGSSPGQAYNPFFVHGSVGLGKTHLLQATCHAILRNHPHYRVVYLSCEEFTNHYINSIQTQSLEAFRAYYRTADVLVIDDIEFLANKSQTQVEFFHTFNALYNCKKQIVLSSDRPAPEIPTLEERLVSRFKWGLETCMEPPCFETRAAIVKRKGQMRGMEFPDAIAHAIAERITTNIRELEGAIIRVVGLAAITNRPIDLDLVDEALRGNAPARKQKVSLDDIMDLITGEFSISAKDLTGKSRTQAISLPRQIGMFLARRHTDHSLEEIGRYFGNRDHTTVLYAVGKIDKRSETDRMFNGLLLDLAQRLTSGSFPRHN